jgi:hypothetical protein
VKDNRETERTEDKRWAREIEHVGKGVNNENILTLLLRGRK